MPNVIEQFLLRSYLPMPNGTLLLVNTCSYGCGDEARHQFHMADRRVHEHILVRQRVRLEREIVVFAR
jgi:hypothetical protein